MYGFLEYGEEDDRWILLLLIAVNFWMNIVSHHDETCPRIMRRQCVEMSAPTVTRCSLVRKQTTGVVISVHYFRIVDFKSVFFHDRRGRRRTLDVSRKAWRQFFIKSWIITNDGEPRLFIAIPKQSACLRYENRDIDCAGISNITWYGNHVIRKSRDMADFTTYNHRLRHTIS